jgi:hypothetical protein
MIKIFLFSLLSQLAAGSVVSLTAENYEATTAGKTVFIKVGMMKQTSRVCLLSIHLSSNLYLFYFLYCT